MLTIILNSFWLFLPAGFANMAPVLFKNINFLNHRNLRFLGCQKSLHEISKHKPINKKLFGKNKTYKGFFFGILTSIIIVYLQKLLYPLTSNISIIDYNSINILLIGFLLGFGALFGDLVESFFKRRLNIKEGKSFLFFDQIDWILGSIILVNIYIKTSLIIIITAIILFGLLHPLINYTGYLLKIKKNKF